MLLSPFRLQASERTDEKKLLPDKHFPDFRAQLRGGSPTAASRAIHLGDAQMLKPRHQNACGRSRTGPDSRAYASCDPHQLVTTTAGGLRRNNIRRVRPLAADAAAGRWRLEGCSRVGNGGVNRRELVVTVDGDDSTRHIDLDAVHSGQHRNRLANGFWRNAHTTSRQPGWRRSWWYLLCRGYTHGGVCANGARAA